MCEKDRQHGGVLETAKEEFGEKKGGGNAKC